ncbi:MAG: uracil-DNA glycosylase [Candidatus Aminicenantaceae bacterium]
MERRAEKLIASLEEKLKFFSQMGIEFISISSSKDTSFHSVDERILKCQKCTLSQGRTNAVPGEGSLEAELMFVGEAPGRDEDLQGRPFVGRAGQLLTKIIGAMKFNREDVYITNVVKCRPPNNRNPNKEEIETCKNYLLEQIEMIKPRAIVALGRVATDFFVHSSLGMTALRGNFHEFNDIQVMPTFHPSYIIRNEGNKSIKKMVWEDMKKVMTFLGKR